MAVTIVPVFRLDLSVLLPYDGGRGEDNVTGLVSGCREGAKMRPYSDTNFRGVGVVDSPTPPGHTPIDRGYQTVKSVRSKGSLIVHFALWPSEVLFIFIYRKT